jgi:hypothetical protein
MVFYQQNAHRPPFVLQSFARRDDILGTALTAITAAMIVQLSAKVSLFLYVRTHSQVAYYLNLADSSRAANDSGSCVDHCEATPVGRSEGANCAGTNIVRLHAARTHSRG